LSALPPLKVLFVYKYLTPGGVEAVLVTRLEELGRLGIEAHAWFFAEIGGPEGRAMFAAVTDRVHLGSPESCLELALEGGFDLVSTIDSEEIFPAFLETPRRELPPLIVEAHSAYRPNVGYLARLGALRPAAVLAPSEHQAGFVRERSGAVVHVVPNPLRRTFLAPAAPFSPAPPRPVVAFVGRLDEHKNWEGFLEVASLLAAPGCEIWIVGQPVGPAGAADLLRRARELGLLSRLRWFHALPHAAMPALFDAVRDSGGATVTTSRGESFGMTVIEAMARGCPVLVPAEGPFTEIVMDGETGAFYPPGDMGAAAEALDSLLQDPERRQALGRRAREEALARFAPEAALAVLAERLRAAAKPVGGTSPAEDDTLAGVPPQGSGERESERWNDEWLAYLRREWEQQLTPYTAYPETPPLPASPLAMIDLKLGFGAPLSLYCDRDALAGRRVMEMGCGCGNLGKLLGRYVESYLGTDYSPLALQVARLVSPANCSYVHVADRDGLAPFFAAVDTVVGRYFWIHQNFEQARFNLQFLSRFLKPAGRLYADFYWPDPAVPQGVVLSPDQPLSRRYPSATFRYTSEAVARLVDGLPFRLLREEVVLEMQRRYVVLERI
jgi:glycosyltransferase involved in cell wall biosynthesis/SAM-dependent methyltransferase